MTQNPRARPRSLRASGSILGAAALLASFIACGDDSTLVNVRPRLVTRPDPGTRLELPEVVLGRTTADPVVVEVGNLGDGVLTFSNVSIEGRDAAQFRVSSHPRLLQAGQWGELFVRYEPKIHGDHEAEVVVATNDPMSPRVTFPVRGPGREACAVTMGPAHQRFLLGEVREVTISAVSSFDCTVVGVLTDRSLFSILNEPELPVVINSGRSLTLEVQHIGVTRQPGIPTRELRIRESEGTEAVVSLEGEPPVYGCLSVFPNRLIFQGRTPVGESRQGRVTVTNTCGRDAAVSSVAISQGFYYFSTDRTGYPKILRPHESLDVWVRYEAFNPSGDPGVLTVNTNDAANPRFRVELYGEAALPKGEIFPQVLNFGSVVFRSPGGENMRSDCASRAQVVQIYSTGDTDLVIDRLEIDAAADPHFQVNSVTVNGRPVFDWTQPMRLAPGEEMRVSLQFYPDRENPPEHQSTLRIHHNAENRVSTVLLMGRGVPDGATEDVFTQLEGPKVDILWVIDDSCSMWDEQARLIQNMSQFVSYADSSNASYQMGVTTTDHLSPSAGLLRRCFPHPAILDSDYPNREAAFACTFDVGTRGGYIEAGLGAAKRALERAMDPVNPHLNPNRGFLRDDAKLAVVAISDEDDQSFDSNAVLRDFFFSVKGAHRPDRVKVHAIAGPVTEPCQQGPRASDPGYRYYWMAQQTGGMFFNICEEDWQPILRRLGLDVFTPTDEWDLSQAADPGTLQVRVDGVLVPYSAANGYTYNIVGNSVRFHGNALPAPGSQITVSYAGLCRP